MSHHGDVTTVLDLLDDAFAGAVDPRELISKMDDPSSFHVNAPLKVRKKKMVVKPTPGVIDEIRKAASAIINHRRLGAITTEQAQELLDDLVSKAGKVADDSHVAAVASTWGASTRQAMADTADVRGPQPNPSPKKGQPVGVKDKPDPKVKQAHLERKVDEIVPKPKKIDPALMKPQPVQAGPEPAMGGPMAAGPQGPPKAPPVKGKVAKKDASKAETRTGQLLNGVAITGGVHAAALTGKNLIEDAKGVTEGKHVSAPKHAKLSTAEKVGEALKGSKVLRPITSNPKRAALVAGGAWMGLHTAELAGDTIAARALKNQAGKTKPTTLSKSVDVEWNGTISKFDTDKRLVFGWCSLSKVDGQPVVDLQGDYVPIETTEDAAYRYVIHSRKGGDMHARVSKRTAFLERDEPLHTSDLIESIVVTPEKLEALGLAPDALPLGWWVGFKVNDEEQWQKVKSGERPGFSIHGSGARVPVSA